MGEREGGDYMLIVGGGKVGWNLARELIDKGHEVTLIEADRERYLTVEQELEHRVLYGDASELWVLERAGIERADVFVASTNGDNTNIVIAQIAQRRFNVETVIARILDPYRAEWYATQGMTTVCPTRTAIEMLETNLREVAASKEGQPDG